MIKPELTKLNQGIEKSVSGVQEVLNDQSKTQMAITMSERHITDLKHVIKEERESFSTLRKEERANRRSLDKMKNKIKSITHEIKTTKSPTYIYNNHRSITTNTLSIDHHSESTPALSYKIEKDDDDSLMTLDTSFTPNRYRLIGTESPLPIQYEKNDENENLDNSVSSSFT